MQITVFDRLAAFEKFVKTLPVGEALVQTGRGLQRLKIPYCVFAEDKNVLTIKTMVEGKCSWCQKETEVLPAEFPDGLKGQFCRTDFWEAAKSRSGISKKEKVKAGENGDGKGKTEPLKS